MWAAGHEDGVNARAAVETIELLLDRGAAIDAADNRGRTALMIAAELGHVPVVEVLLRRGADRSKTDKSGKTRARSRDQHGRARDACREVTR